MHGPQCAKKESCKLPKGFAIGSAALVSLALYGAFVIRLRVKTGVPWSRFIGLMERSLFWNAWWPFMQNIGVYNIYIYIYTYIILLNDWILLWNIAESQNRMGSCGKIRGEHLGANHFRPSLRTLWIFDTSQAQRTPGCADVRPSWSLAAWFHIGLQLSQWSLSEPLPGCKDGQRKCGSDVPFSIFSIFMHQKSSLRQLVRWWPKSKGRAKLAG